MGKAEDKYTPTPEQLAAAAKIVVPLDWPPEQLAAMRRRMAEGLKEAAEMERIGKRLDRYIAIRDGQIRPPWMEQTEPKPAETPEPASEPVAPKKQGKQRKSRAVSLQRVHVDERVCLLWPPDGKPPEDMPWSEVEAEVLKHLPGTDSTMIKRATGRRKG